MDPFFTPLNLNIPRCCRKYRLALALATLLLSGCGLTAPIVVGTGAMPVTKRPTYDVPSQVIYRIDEKRFFTIENYEDCSTGGDVYYHDERAKLKTKISPQGVGIWPGKFSIEPTDTHVVLPGYGCGNKGCYLSINFSTDGGKSFDRFYSWHFGFPHMQSDPEQRDEPKQTSVVVKRNMIYVAGKQSWVEEYRFEPGMTDTAVMNSEYKEYEKRLKVSPAAKTPSGQDRFICDTSIRPKNLPSAK